MEARCGREVLIDIVMPVVALASETSSPHPSPSSPLTPFASVIPVPTFLVTQTDVFPHQEQDPSLIVP